MQSDAAGTPWLVTAAAGVARTSGIAELDARASVPISASHSHTKAAAMAAHR
jgi:hypothetical protein